MNAPLLSSWWYRVAARKPKLRAHARLHRHRYRGEVWYLLQDPASSRVHRFTPAARLIIALMDGERTVAEIAAAIECRRGGDGTRAEVSGALQALVEHEILTTEPPGAGNAPGSPLPPDPGPWLPDGH